MNTYLHATIAMLTVINPTVCAMMLLQTDNSGSKKSIILSGIKAMISVLVILVIAALAGNSILSAFGISLDAFKVVGGIILAFIGFQMMSEPKETHAASSPQTGLTPVIMFAASPGTITMVITLSVVHNAGNLPINAIIGSILAIIISITIISTIAFISKPEKPNKQGLVSKFMGLLIVAMGIQFLLDGIKQFYAL